MANPLLQHHGQDPKSHSSRSNPPSSSIASASSSSIVNKTLPGLPLRSLSTKKSSRRGLRAVETSSPPSTSNPQRSPTGAGKAGKAQKVARGQDHQTSPLQYGSPANSPTLTDTTARASASATSSASHPRPKQQRKHSHGLSFSSHTRDSLVDNLLLSLDQISDQPPETTSNSFDSEPSPRLAASPPRLPMSQFNASRTRGHNQSPSISSEQDRNDSPSRYAGQGSPHTRRPSGLSTSRILNGMRGSRQDSIDKDSPDTNHGRGWSRHGSKSSEIANGDYSSASPSRLRARDASRERDFRSRQQSGDLYHDSILSRGRPIPPNNATANAAPEPTIPPGPGSSKESPGPPKSVFNTQRSGTQSRKQSSQSQSELPRSPKLPSDIPEDVRNQAVEFVRASSMRNLGQPTVAASIGSATPPGSMHKYQGGNQDEKRGFFKRVFGSSNSKSNLHASESAQGNASPAVSRQGSYSNIHHPNGHAATRQREASPAPSGSTRELNKKPSSFFRRRKKSVTDSGEPPALPPPPQLSGPEQVESPTRSSLYKAMDPYLADPNSTTPSRPQARAATYEPRVPKTREDASPSSEDTDDPALFHTGYKPSPDGVLKSIAPENDPRRPSEAPSAMSVASNDLPLRNQSTAGGSSPTLKMKDRKKDKPTSLSPPPTRAKNLGTDDAAVSATSVNLVGKGRTSPVSPLPPAKPGLTVDTASPRTQQGDFVKSKAAAGQAEDSRVYLQPSPVDPTEEVFVTPHEKETFLTPTNEGSQEPEMTARITSPDDLGLTYESLSSAPAIQVDGEEHISDLAAFRSERAGSDDVPRNMSVATTGTAMTSMTAMLEGPTFEDREHALSIFNGDEDFMPRQSAATFLGDRKTASVNTLYAFIELFNFTGQTILGGMRMLCNRLILKAESQQVDRILDAFASRWCECNPEHGFKLKDVVHTMCYSLLLLNTDLHMADIESKMTRAQFVKNTLPTIKRVVADAPPDAFEPSDRPTGLNRPGIQWQDSTNSIGTSGSSTKQDGDGTENRRISTDSRRPTLTKRMSWTLGMGNKDEVSMDLIPNSGSNALVAEKFDGKPAEWHYELESILKSFFTAIKNEALPLNSDRHGLQRRGSVKSMAPSEMSVRSKKTDFHSMSRWGRNRGRSKFYGSSTLASSRTSFDDGSSLFSPAGSSAWSKLSLGKTLTTMSTDSLGTHLAADQGFPQTIGFANALSQMNAREDGVEDDNMSINPQKFLLEDDTLELAGAPWGKEGLVKHKHHLEATEKKAKERNWNECFAVIEKGYLRLFSFNSKGGKTGSLGVRKSMQKAAGVGPYGGSGSGTKPPSIAPSVVGGGNWMQNAESLGSFLLRQTIASTLPPPGYSKARPHVWALSLPTGAVHLFQVGTAEIAKEFMTTANYWSARLSKEPLMGGVDNIEYGWSESIIVPSLVHPSLVAAATAQSSPEMGAPAGSKPPSRAGAAAGGHSTNNSLSMPHRGSITGSMRSSIDQGMMRARMIGDKAHLEDWQPPAQSMMASQLMEVDQLKGLKDYVANVEAELTRHNELRGNIPGAYSPRAANLTKAINNWEKKSAYLLREIVKFRTYIDALNVAAEEKAKLDKDRAERAQEKEDRETRKREREDAAAAAVADAERAAAEGSKEGTPRMGAGEEGDGEQTPSAVTPAAVAEVKVEG